MATTKIWAIKDSVSRVLTYAANPEKTVLSDLKKVLHYAENDKKTINGEEKICFVSGVNCNADTAFDEMISVQKRYGKTDGNVAYHAYQSFKTGEVTPELCHQIGVKLARKMWGNDYQVIIATHFNTGTYHNHFVVNSVNMWTGKKFNCNEGVYWKFRALSDELCAEHNLTVIKNPSGKTPRSIYFSEKNGEPTKFNLMREAIDFAIKHSRSFKDFEYIMREQGYYVSLNSNRKYWTIRSVNSKKYVRMYRLGEEYSNDSIRKRIHEQGIEGWKNSAVYYENRRQMKLFQPRSVVFKGNFKAVKKITGLYALYLHYCYLLGKLPKDRQRRPLSPEMREAWRHLDRISRQVTLISNKDFKSLEDVEKFVKNTNSSINEVTNLRYKIYNKLRRCDDKGKCAELFSERDKCTDLLKQLRKEKKIALTIIEDNPKIKENIRLEIQAQNLTRGRKSNYRKKEYIR